VKGESVIKAAAEGIRRKKIEGNGVYQTERKIIGRIVALYRAPTACFACAYFARYARQRCSAASRQRSVAYRELQRLPRLQQRSRRAPRRATLPALQQASRLLLCCTAQRTACRARAPPSCAPRRRRACAPFLPFRLAWRMISNNQSGNVRNVGVK